MSEASQPVRVSSPAPDRPQKRKATGAGAGKTGVTDAAVHIPSTCGRRQVKVLPRRQVECDACGTEYKAPVYTFHKWLATCARAAACELQRHDDAGGGKKGAPTVVFSTCGCGRRAKVCLPCVVRQMRETRRSTSVCMECPHKVDVPAVQAMLAIAGGTGAVTTADNGLVDQIAEHAALQAANMHVPCPCHGTVLDRVGKRFVQPTSATLPGSKGKAAHAAVPGHEPLCATCLQPCGLADECECREPQFRENPYFRQPGMRQVARNHEITPELARHFLQTLWDMPAGPVQCVCGTWLLRTVDCHEVTCKCGHVVCYACARAGYDAGRTKPLEGHFDFPGPTGAEPCAMFPIEYRVTVGGLRLDQRCPCRSSDGEFASVSGTAACHGHRSDCRRPEHRKWISLYDANRRAAQAQAFVEHLKGTPAYEAAAEELGKQPWFLAYGLPSAAEVAAADDGAFVDVSAVV